jgi:hypothetical protein
MIRRLFLPLVALSSQVWGADYVFLFEGKEYEREPQAVFGVPGSPAKGDVLWVWDFPVVLAGPGRYEFRLGNKQGTVLLGRLPGEETERPVGVKVDTDYEDDKTILLDPLSEMKPETKGGLRAVVLEKIPEKPDAALQGIHWAQASLVVSETFSSNKEQTLRDLPAGLKYLAFDVRSSPSLRDVSSLSKATELLWLRLDSSMTVNAGIVAGMSKLRSFHAGWADLENAPALAGLKELRDLNLGGVDEVKDLGFVSSMPELRRLNVAQTPVTSLRPLAGLKKLEEVDADQSAVKELPSTAGVPSLKRLTLLSAPVPEAKVDEFRKALPACKVDSSWHATLSVALKDVDRLRVRTGGTCHRDIEGEKTLFEVADAAEIQRLVESWKVEDDKSGFHCMCCGEPSLEFYKGGKLVTTLGFHHGSSLRWPDGWPGDALLTTVASDSICDFLARHGIDGPKKELEESRKREAANQRLWAAYTTLAEESVLEKFRAALEGGSDPFEVAVKAWPDAVERAARLFSLYGALPDGTWRVSTGMDEPLRDGMLVKVEAKVAVDLSKRGDAPEMLLQGLSRWAFFGKEGEAFLKALDDETLRKLGTWALTHPRSDNREEALHALASKAADPVSRSLLLDFLAGKLTPRKPASEDAEDPDGAVTYLPHQDTPPEGAGEKALCAWLLSKNGVSEARPLIEGLVKDAAGPDKEAFEKSLESLKAK